VTRRRTTRPAGHGGAASSSLFGIHRDLLALFYGFSVAMALLAIAAYASALVTAARTTHRKPASLPT